MQGARALVADGNLACREALERNLTSWSLECVGTGHAEGVLAALERAVHSGRPFDLLILDPRLPGADAGELVARIAREPVFAGLRTIVLGTLSNAPGEEGRRADDSWPRLAKPVRRSELFEAVLGALCRGRPADRPDASPERANAMPEIAALHGSRVLLVEDNPVNQEVARGMLERMGVELAVANDGQEALVHLGQHEFDLVLMDCQMAGLDGYQTTAEIRRLEESGGHRERMPIVALTADAVDGDRETCLAAGMDDYLAKPFTYAGLAQIVERWHLVRRTARRTDRVGAAAL